MVVVVFMCVTSVLICRMMLLRFCSGEFFTYLLFLSLFGNNAAYCRVAGIVIVIVHIYA